MSPFFALLAPFVAFCLLTLTLSRIGEQTAGPTRLVPEWPVTHACGAFLALMLVIYAVHNLYFGTDSATYAMLFTSYCSGWRGTELTHEYLITFGFLNTLMVGSCTTDALTFAWTAAIAVPLLALRTDTATKLRYAALFFATMTAFDVTTNTLRQGVAATVLTAAISYYPRRKVISAVGCLLALAIHASSGLVLVAFAISTLPVRYYYIALAAVGGLVSLSVLTGHQLIAGTRFYYELTKYIAHEGAEVNVRILAYAALFIPLGVLRLVGMHKQEGFHRAFFIAMTALPLVTVPYFSYRYIYGILPVVLWYALLTAKADPTSYRRFVTITLIGEMSLLLLLSVASSDLRSGIFLG